MTTRFTAIDQINNGVSGVKSGYDTGLKSDLVIPSCGIEDVDVALFNLFDKEISPMIGGQDSADSRKVPVIFAAGEKWALLKRGKPIRDKTNTLILPLITIMRTGLSQGPEDIAGRGINQQTGELVVRRRLDASDRDYQNLLNKSFITFQSNASVNVGDPSTQNQDTTGRKIGESRATLNTRRGAFLASNLGNNIYETIVVPSPQFYTATYQVTVWTQYTQHMNQIIEKVMASFLPQAQSWKITTNKGYWFVASTDGGAFDTETNFDDMSTAERFLKCSFSIKVPAYFWVSSAPGAPVPVKKYISSPIIQFTLASKGLPDPTPDSLESFYNNFLIGNDDPTLPLADRQNARPDQRRTGSSLTPFQGVVQTANPEVAPLVSSPETTNFARLSATNTATDPATTTVSRGTTPPVYTKNKLPQYPNSSATAQAPIEVKMGSETKYVKVVSKNSTTGETVYTQTNVAGGLEIIPVNKPE